jgi:tRNA dimethylallyltransferase
MDIGTAKPTPEELASAPHHLIDITTRWTPILSCSFAPTPCAVAEISARGACRCWSRHTMMYFKGLFDGWTTLPTATRRAAPHSTRKPRESAAGMHARLAALDPVTAARLNPNDASASQRALEIIELTGQPMSNCCARANPSCPSSCCSFALEPSRPQRAAPAHRHPLRRDAGRDDGGLLAEVARLRARGDLHPDCLDALRRLPPGLGIPGRPIDRAALRDKGIAATRAAGQAPADLAALDAGPDRHRLPGAEPAPAELLLAEICTAGSAQMAEICIRASHSLTDFGRT